MFLTQIILPITFLPDFISIPHIFNFFSILSNSSIFMTTNTNTVPITMMLQIIFTRSIWSPWHDFGFKNIRWNVLLLLHGSELSIALLTKNKPKPSKRFEWGRMGHALKHECKEVIILFHRVFGSVLNFHHHLQGKAILTSLWFFQFNYIVYEIILWSPFLLLIVEFFGPYNTWVNNLVNWYVPRNVF